MDATARVTNSAALADLASAVSTFAALAQDALAGVDLDIQRTIDWLEHQRQHWTFAVRKGEEAVVHARNELSRRKMMKIGDRPVGTTDQELTLAKARRRLEYVEEKLRRTKHWQRLLPQEVLDHQAAVKILQNSLESDLPRMRAFLDRKIQEIDEYAQGNP